MVEHFIEMMAGSLRLKEPWFVESAKFDAENQRVDIHVAVRSEALFAYLGCGGGISRYGYEPQERLLVPRRLHVPSDLRPLPQAAGRLPGMRRQAGERAVREEERADTTYFEGHAMMLLADMPRAAAARALRCDGKTMAGIASCWVNLANGRRSLKDLARPALDETSFRRGHDYVTPMVDAEERCVVDVEEDRDKDTVANFCRKLVEEGGDPANVTAVTGDMSKSFCLVIAESFPNASHVIDKFHVNQIVTTAMDEARKLEQKVVTDKRRPV